LPTSVAVSERYGANDGFTAQLPQLDDNKRTTTGRS